MASNIFLEDTCQVRYYGVSGDKKTSLDQLFSHANPEKDTVIVLVDPHIWNLMQMHTLAKLFEWMFDNSYKSLKYIYLITKDPVPPREFEFSKTYNPVRPTPNLPIIASDVCTNIYKIAWQRFLDKNNEDFRKSATPISFSVKAFNRAHDRSMTILNTNGVYRFDLGRGIGIFQAPCTISEAQLIQTPLHDLKCFKFMAVMTFIKPKSSLTDKQKHAKKRDIFVKFFKHEHVEAASEFFEETRERKTKQLAPVNPSK